MDNEFFVIVRLSRDDFVSRGFNPKGLTDEQMRNIAKKMGDVYVENMFWEQVDYFADEYHLPTYE